MSLISANSSLTFENNLPDIFTTFSLQQNWPNDKSWSELVDLCTQVSSGKQCKESGLSYLKNSSHGCW